MFSQKFHLNHRLSALNSGRSMLEMLAVIALIGVISIGGLWSFMYATAKHDATAIMEDVASRAVRVMTTDANYRDRPADFEWQFAKMKNDTIKTLKSDKPAYIYRVVVLPSPVFISAILPW